jgi:hypothetical protein
MLAFLFGALPFILYNVRHPNATLGGNAHIETASVRAVLAGKLSMVQGALDGSGLFGYLAAPDWMDGSHPPRTPLGRAAQALRDRIGEHQSSGFDYVFLLSILAVPLWWKKRAARFALVFMMVTWLAMAITRDAGGAIHHAVLLWPFPQFFVAVVLASLPWPRLAAVLAVMCIATNLVVDAEYLRELDSNGAAGNFTDALFPLSDAIPENGHPVYVVDWGMANTIAMFHKGRALIRPADAPFRTDTPTEGERNIIQAILLDPDAIFVGHVPAREVMTGVSANLNRAAASYGRKKEMIRAIADSNGRPVFEVFRYAPTP